MHSQPVVRVLVESRFRLAFPCVVFQRLNMATGTQNQMKKHKDLPIGYGELLKGLLEGE